MLDVRLGDSLSDKNRIRRLPRFHHKSIDKQLPAFQGDAGPSKDGMEQVTT
jgi:hypothetical protein